MDTGLLFFWLPAVLVDVHVHGRDMSQNYKTTVLETLLIAKDWFREFVFGFMPNTQPAIDSIAVLAQYKDIVGHARKKIKVNRRQLIWFKVTDSNYAECKVAIKDRSVIGLKIYAPEIKYFCTFLRAMELCWLARKSLAVHCDDPLIIAKEGYSKRAEAECVKFILSLAEYFPGIKIVICHVSCRESVELILAAQEMGMLVVLEICPQYLWFDTSRARRNPSLHENFYLCLNRIRDISDRLFLLSLLLDNNKLIVISSDHAPHTEAEKLEGASGFPSLVERVAVLITLAIQYGISKERVAELLSFNAMDFFGIQGSRKLVKYQIGKMKVDVVYGPKVVSPWGELFYPVEWLPGTEGDG